MMNLYKLIKKGSVIGSVLLFAQIIKAQTTITNFPYTSSLRGTTIPAEWGKPGAANYATASLDGLKLTSTTLRSYGGIILNDVDFNSTNGMIVSFEYSMYDGTALDGQHGDGLSFFLFDSSKNPALGAIGRGLGYSMADGFGGVDGGYLGIGFDEFGNFKDNTDRNGISPETSKGPSHITLRGAMGANRFSGYPVLATRRTNLAYDSNYQLSMHLDSNSGYFSQSRFGLSMGQTFNIRPGYLSTTNGDSYYRKAKLTLLPRSGGGFRISLEVTHGQTTSVIFSEWAYPESIKYNENPNSSSLDNIVTLSTPVPQKFQMGFAASNGGASQIHLIRDIEVTLPFMPAATNDEVSMCYNSTEISPFTNDTFYRGSLTGTPTSGNDVNYVDYNSFQFSDVNDNPVGTPINSLPYKTYTQSGVGTWIYSVTTGKVTFTPSPGYVGQASIYYTAKGLSTGGGPFNQEIYRSAPSKLSVSVKRCGTSINPQLPSGAIIRSGR